MEDTHKKATDAPEAQKTAQNDILDELAKDDLFQDSQQETEVPEFSLEDVLAEFSDHPTEEKEPISEPVEETAAEATPVEEEVTDEDADVTVWPAAPADKTDPAFENPEKITDPDETMIFRNFSNNYGKDIPVEDTAAKEAALQKQKDDKTITGLLIATAALSTGIIGILAYWLVTFLK